MQSSRALDPEDLHRPIRSVLPNLARDSAALGRLGITTPREALWYLPFRYDDFSSLKALRDLEPDEKQSAKPRGGIARWAYEDGRALLLTEAGTERKAGVWVVDGDPEAQEPLAHLGPEADSVDAAALLEISDCSCGQRFLPCRGRGQAQRLAATSRLPCPSAEPG